MAHKIDKHLFYQVHHLSIIINESHFKINTSKFCQMPGSMGLFCPKYWSQFINSFKTASYKHLLVNLRRLRQIGRFSKIIQNKQFCSRFHTNSGYLWGVDIGKSLAVKEIGQYF